MIKTAFHRYFELIFWITALIALAVANPAAQSQYALCPFKLLGITWCPGCGLGHAISFLFHGDIKNSFHAHWLGVPALALILHCIYTLAALRFKQQMGRKNIFELLN